MNDRAAAPRGAMTTAMRAANAPAAPLGLRVAVIDGTRVVSEQVFRGDAVVSLGRSERATFSVPDAAAPELIELFTVRGGERRLVLVDGLDGRVSDGEHTRSLGELRGGASLALDDRWRGRLLLGDVTVLFQFVRLGAEAQRAQLPAAIRARPLRGLDWAWNACAGAFLALSMAGAGYAEYVYDPIVDDDIERVLRFVRIMSPEPTAPRREPAEASAETQAASEPSRESAATSTSATNHAAEPSRRRDPRGSAQASAATAAARADSAARAAIDGLRASTFASLTGALRQGNGSARDLLAQGAVQESTAAALRDTYGVTTASRSGIAGRTDGDPDARRSLCGEACMAQRAVRSDGPQLSSGTLTRERVIAPIRVPTEQPIDGDGQVDAHAVASSIRSQLGGVRSCYERALRSNPDLRGRLEVRFTLGETGRITRIQSQGMSEAPEVGACVSQRLRNIAFPPARGGTVEFMFPFVLDRQ